MNVQDRAEVAWAGARKLAKLLPSLSEPFLIPVKSCVDACAEAMEQMPKPDTAHVKYPVAAERLTILAMELDTLRKSDTSLAEGIDEKRLATRKFLDNLAGMISRRE